MTDERGGTGGREPGDTGDVPVLPEPAWLPPRKDAANFSWNLNRSGVSGGTATGDLSAITPARRDNSRTRPGMNRPGVQQPDEPTSSAGPTPPDEPTESVDMGHFLAIPRRAWERRTAPPADEGDARKLYDDDEGEPTAAFDFRAPPPLVEPLAPPEYRPGHTLRTAPGAITSAGAGGVVERRDPHASGSPAAGASDSDPSPTAAIDSIFGTGSFQPYADSPADGLLSFPSAAPRPREEKPRKPPKAARPPRAVAAPAAKTPGIPRQRQPLSVAQRRLAWLAGGLVGLLLLAALFLVGTRLPESAPTAQVPANEEPAVEAPAPVVTEPPAVISDAVGPLAPGVHEWNTLLGTECIDPFTSPWAEEFTVVDCSEPHAAQMVYHGRFAETATDAYPGADALQARMNLLCATPENIDYAAASRFADIQVSASYAATDEEWSDGDRNYYCFVTRSSGEPLTASVAMPARADVVVPVVPAPEP